MTVRQNLPALQISTHDEAQTGVTIDCIAGLRPASQTLFFPVKDSLGRPVRTRGGTELQKSMCFTSESVFSVFGRYCDVTRRSLRDVTVT
jgi:hypothetical protein